MVTAAQLKLGKGPAVIPPRTLKMSNILRALPPIPDSFDVDDQLQPITDTHVFANDKVGDCVVAEAGHQILRFEKFQQGIVLPITDQEILNDYFLETGGPDSGLIMVNHLNWWKNKGILIGGKTYTIDAFANINQLDPVEVAATMYLLRGASLGLALPISAQAQWDNSQPWTLTTGPDAQPGSWGEHCTFLKRKEKALTKVRYALITWGKEQEVDEDWFTTYCNEAWGIVDNKDSWLSSDPLDIKALEAYLAEITGNLPLTIQTQSITQGTVGVGYDFFMSATGGKPPYTWSIYTGNFPKGLSMYPNGNIFGYPEKAEVQGLIFQVTDAAGAAGLILLYIQINNPPTPPTPTPSKCKVGNAVAKTLNLYSQTAKRQGRFFYLNPPRS